MSGHGLRAENEEGDDTGGPQNQIEGGNRSWVEGWEELTEHVFEKCKKEEK